MLANSAEYWVVALYSGLAVMGLLGNIWVMMSVLGEWCRCCHPQWPRVRCKPAKHCSASIYLLILSIVDLISILPVPLLATDILYNEWPFGLLLCKLLFFCEGANKSLSPLVLIALSVDRYVAVCRATVVWLRRPKFSIFVLLACFLLSLFFIMPVVCYAEISDMVDANYKEHPKCVVQMSKSFDIVHICICYLLPLLLICSVYVSILRRLYRHTRTSTVGRRTSISLGRVLKCSVFVVAFYFVCWTPYWTLRVVAVLQEPPELPLALYDIEMALNGSLDFVPDVDTISPSGHRTSGQATHQVAIMYMVHALPYAQSAFNWLFYAFLNRNLRQSTTCCNTATRSAAITSNFFDSVHATSAGGTVVSLWNFIQSTSTRLRSIAEYTANVLLRQSAFRPRMHVTTRSWAFLERAAAPNVGANVPNEHVIINALNPSSDERNTSRNERCLIFMDLEQSSRKLCLAISEYSYAGGSVVTKCRSSWSIIESPTSSDPRCKDVIVVAFIIYPAAANSFNVESLKGQAVCKQLRETIAKIKENVAARMFEACQRGHIPDMKDLLLPAESIQLKRCILAARRDNLPPICTHNMIDDAGDPVLNAFRRTQLINRHSDRVKVIFHPEFLSSVSPLMNLDYEDFVRGCHIGVFPSYYEPWGYTPAECTVMGVPSVTTNLSGFGCFIHEHVQDPQTYGVFVIDRRFKSANESIDELAQVLYDFTLLSRRQRIIMRNRTERLSELFDWKNLGSFYREARRMALQKTHPDLVQVIQETVRRMPRPVSAPSTPSTSRPTSPHESEDESDTAEQEAFEEKAWKEQ